jgi:hypothetical protein
MQSLFGKKKNNARKLLATLALLSYCSFIILGYLHVLAMSAHTTHHHHTESKMEDTCPLSLFMHEDSERGYTHSFFSFLSFILPDTLLGYTFTFLVTLPLLFVQEVTPLSLLSHDYTHKIRKKLYKLFTLLVALFASGILNPKKPKRCQLFFITHSFNF